MLTDRSLSVSVEEVAVGIPSGLAIEVDTASFLLDTWCTHELGWVVYERNTPSVWAQVVRQLRGYLMAKVILGQRTRGQTDHDQDRVPPASLPCKRTAIPVGPEGSAG